MAMNRARKATSFFFFRDGETAFFSLPSALFRGSLGSNVTRPQAADPRPVACTKHRPQQARARRTLPKEQRARGTDEAPAPLPGSRLRRILSIDRIQISDRRTQKSQHPPLFPALRMLIRLLLTPAPVLILKPYTRQDAIPICSVVVASFPSDSGE